MEIWILFGLGLAVYALITHSSSKAKGNIRPNANRPPPSTQSAGTTLQNQRRVSPPPLPPRRTASAATGRTWNIAPGPGPRGIQASQFPCCPYCHQRNDGTYQKIFWNCQENLYHCSRGHKFYQNGRPFIS